MVHYFIQVLREENMATILTANSGKLIGIHWKHLLICSWHLYSGRNVRNILACTSASSSSSPLLPCPHTNTHITCGLSCQILCSPTTASHFCPCVFCVGSQHCVLLFPTLLFSWTTHTNAVLCLHVPWVPHVLFVFLWLFSKRLVKRLAGLEARGLRVQSAAAHLLLRGLPTGVAVGC